MDDQPPTDSPAKDLATFYAGRFHLELIVAGFLVAAAGIFLALFAGLIRERLGTREPGLVAIAYASGLLYATMLVAGAALASTIPVARAVNDVPPPSPEVARYVVSSAYAMIVWVATLPAAVFIVSTSLAAMRTRVVPAWVAWAGVAFAVLNAAFITVGPIGWMLLWTLIFSVAWVRRGAPEREASGVVAAAV
jgi:MFS family permease